MLIWLNTGSSWSWSLSSSSCSRSGCYLCRGGHCLHLRLNSLHNLIKGQHKGTFDSHFNTVPIVLALESWIRAKFSIHCFLWSGYLKKWFLCVYWIVSLYNLGLCFQYVSLLRWVCMSFVILYFPALLKVKYLLTSRTVWVNFKGKHGFITSWFKISYKHISEKEKTVCHLEVSCGMTSWSQWKLSYSKYL